MNRPGEVSFDFIIVGAGSAGCVLANLLSARPNTTVLLLEAGGGDRHPYIHIPAAFIKTFTDPRLCAAIVDRLTFAGQIIETGTTSYRLAHARTRRTSTAQ